MLFISPHLDDAVLSCGGYISKLCALGYPVQVLTLFSGSPQAKLSLLARMLHMEWHLPNDAPAERRKEDKRALSILGATAIHADFPDCIYRRDPNSGKALYRRIEQVLGQEMVSEPRMVEKISDFLTEMIQAGGYDHVFAPLGLGGHVDHLITHAAVRLVEKSGLAAQFHYYEDLPYAIGKPLDAIRAGGTQYYFCTSNGREQTKYEAMAQYASQIKSARYAGGIDIDAIIDYGKRVGAKVNIFSERVWILD